MRENIESGIKPEKISSKDESQNDVEYIDFNLKIRCVKTRGGKPKFCSIRDISIDEPGKDPASDGTSAAPQTDVPAVTADQPAVAAPQPSVISVPATSPVAAAPQELPDGTDAECDLCQALEATLKQKVQAAAPRRQFLPREQRARRRVV